MNDAATRGACPLSNTTFESKVGRLVQGDGPCVYHDVCIISCLPAHARLLIKPAMLLARLHLQRPLALWRGSSTGATYHALVPAGAPG